MRRRKADVGGPPDARRREQSQRVVDDAAHALAVETDYVASLQSAETRADKLSMFATYFGNPALVKQVTIGFNAVPALLGGHVAPFRCRPAAR